MANRPLTAPVRLLVAVVAAAGWCAAVAGAVCLFTGLAGGIWAPADFLNQFAPVWSLLGLAGCLVLLVVSRRRRSASVLALGVLAASSVIVGPELAARMALRFREPPAEVRIVQFNAWQYNRSAAHAAAWLLNQRADVLVLQEVKHNSLRMAEALRAQYPFAVTCRGQKACSTVILSRTAPIASAGLARGDADDRKALSAAWAQYDLGGRSITVVAAHLARPWPWGRQDEDRRLLIEEVGKLSDQNLILVGDFNTTPWTSAGKRQDQALGMRRITRALFTWPVYMKPRTRFRRSIPFLPIDQAYLRPGLLPVAVRRGPNLGSDHLPVVIDLAWAPLRDQRVVE